MKILLVDDHAMVREGFRRILSDAFGAADFGEAATGGEALDLVRADAWDVVVLDLSLPGRGGLETLKEIRALRPGVPVLVMTMHAEDQYAVRAFRAGAAGYVTKGASPREFVSAIEKVVGGGKYVTAAVAERLASNAARRDGQVPHESLSDRELEVLRRIGRGSSVKEIAAELVLSPKTVSTYRTRILEKLGLRSTAQLVQYAVERKLSE